MKFPIIAVCGVYYDGKGCQHTAYKKHMFLDEIETKFDAYKVKEWKTVNNITVDETGFILQVGGYSDRRGLYCDVY